MKNILFLLLAFNAQAAFAQLIFSTAPKAGEEYHTVGLELTGVNKNELKKHTKKGKKKVLVLIPLTIPATGKSTLFSNIQ